MDNISDNIHLQATELGFSSFTFNLVGLFTAVAPNLFNFHVNKMLVLGSFSSEICFFIEL